MFFIFGYGPRTKELGPDVERNCPNCNNRRVWQRFEERNWVSLFFIPVIPTGRKRMTLCPVCNYGYEEDDG
ncbi:MAG: zinc-ribbon domain-containing protein, partial [Candidatus Krumholzibacteria bacterium]|nr:zinc-ribbon domain-containing protein [Candidatus Krumholzibacteria bacterium]